MIVHILKMYNLQTWDEIIPYVQQSHNKTLQNSISHNPFQVWPGFHPLAPTDVALPIPSKHEESLDSHDEVDKVTKIIERIHHIQQQVHDILQKSNVKYKYHHDQHQSPHKFKVGNQVWLNL